MKLTQWYAWLGALLTSVGGCAGDSNQSAQAVLPAVRELHHEATRADYLASLYDDYQWENLGRDFHTQFVLSLDGERLAAVSLDDVRVFDLATKSRFLIEGARPVMWLDDSRTLLLITAALDFVSFRDGRVTREPWLQATLGSALRNRRDFSAPGLFSADSALIAVPQSSTHIRVANLRRRESFGITVGAGFGRTRPFNDVRVGWDVARQEPAIFVSHQWFEPQSNPHSIEIENRVEVFGADGRVLFRGAHPGREVTFVPLLVDGRVVMLSRERDVRCINSIDSAGGVREFLACHTDLESAIFDRTGEAIALKSHLSPQQQLPATAVAASGFSRLRYLGRLVGGGVAYLGEAAAPEKQQVIHVKEGAITASFAVQGPPHGPHAKILLGSDLPSGAPVTAIAADRFPAQGFLFTPLQGTPRGLVVSLHGGPREATTERLASVFGRALLEQGFAVAAVNYRGGPGYGRAHLENPYGQGVAGMLEDADAIKAAALAALDLPRGSPVILHGASYGGYLALLAASQNRQTFRSFIVESASCDISTTLDDVSYSDQHLSLSRVLDPDKAVHSLRIATRRDGTPGDFDICGARLPVGVRVVFAHSKDDPVTPFAPLRKFLDRQRPESKYEFICDGCGHSPLALLALNPELRSQVLQAMLGFLADDAAQGE